MRTTIASIPLHRCCNLLLSLALASACDLPGETDDDGVGGSAGAGAGASENGAEDTSPLVLPPTPYNYADPDLPAHYRSATVRGLDNTPADNPITDAGATLGRVLFYDVALSRSETVACASCHQQAAGFSDTAKLSEGFDGGLTGRNSMGLADARWYASGRFFWDERAATLEDQVLMPIENSVEMGMTLDEVIERVEARGYYEELFVAAFGDEVVTRERIALALAQFVRAMAAYRTRFDVELARAGSITEDFAGFTAEENLGKAIFLGPRGGCGVCHLPLPGGPGPGPGGGLTNQAIFQPLGPINNGLDAETATDGGVGDITGAPQDDGKFKSPSLRNVAVSAPYMHDGRFATLAEVVEFYDHGVQAHPNLDPRLRAPGGQPRRLGLSAAEKQALVAFLGTLTDDALRADPKFGDPFVR